MGWARGSELAETVWKAVERYIPSNAREHVARKVVDAFENYDCDTIEEATSLCDAAGIHYDEEGQILSLVSKPEIPIESNSQGDLVETMIAENNRDPALDMDSFTAMTPNQMMHSVHRVYAQFISTDWPSVARQMESICDLILRERSQQRLLKEIVHGVADHLWQGLYPTPQAAATDLYVACGVRAGEKSHVVQKLDAAIAEANRVLDGVKDIRDRIQSQCLMRTEILQLIEQFCVGPPCPSMWDDLAESISILRDLNAAANLGDLIYHVRESECLGWDGPKVTQWSNAVQRVDNLLAKYPQ